MITMVGGGLNEDVLLRADSGRRPREGDCGKNFGKEMSWQRIVAQVVITGTQIVGKAFLQAQASGCKRQDAAKALGCGEERGMERVKR